jgi:N-acetylglucosaminyldiphosphoundecaprenol N-acetyl-beta-D-mannosaminyltransferase
MNTPRVQMMGCQIDNLTMQETLQRVEGFVRSGLPHQHVVVNVDKLVKAQRDPALRQIINNCALVNVDGMPVVWASRWLGKPLKERVTGVDLFDALMGHAARKGWRVFLLGATEEVVQTVRDRYQQRFPTLHFAGVRNGYWRPDEEAAVVQQIALSRADLLFVAIPSPHKEQFLGAHQARMRVPFAMGVGGSFDVMAGKVKRAPRWMQQAGLEWFYRFLQEPRRMFRRYFIEDMAFFGLLLREWRAGWSAQDGQRAFQDTLAEAHAAAPGVPAKAGTPASQGAAALQRAAGMPTAAAPASSPAAATSAAGTAQDSAALQLPG